MSWDDFMCEWPWKCIHPSGLCYDDTHVVTMCLHLHAELGYDMELCYECGRSVNMDVLPFCEWWTWVGIVTRRVVYNALLD